MSTSLMSFSAKQLPSSVLLIEDAPDLRELLKIFLKRAGHEVRAVSSAKEALDSIKAYKFDLILSDIGLPDQDGISLLQAVRSLKDNMNSDIPAVALTGFGRSDHPPGQSLSIFQAMLQKPVDRATLIEVINGLLDQDLAVSSRH